MGKRIKLEVFLSKAPGSFYITSSEILKRLQLDKATYSLSPENEQTVNHLSEMFPDKPREKLIAVLKNFNFELDSFLNSYYDNKVDFN